MSWTVDKEARSQRIRAEIAEETIAALRQRVEELQRENNELEKLLRTAYDGMDIRGSRISQLEEGLREIARPSSTTSSYSGWVMELQSIARSLLDSDSGSAGVCEPSPERGSPDEAAPALNIEEG